MVQVYFQRVKKNREKTFQNIFREYATLKFPILDPHHTPY